MCYKNWGVCEGGRSFMVMFNLIATDNKSKNNYDNCIINIKSTLGHQKEEEGGI